MFQKREPPHSSRLSRLVYRLWAKKNMRPQEIAALVELTVEQVNELLEQTETQQKGKP
jgi:rRNA pseudouridine-1189 N-methylase Emg1 (Nep1/Mra1 family)